MKKIRTMCWVATLALLSSCYEDKGNYDYGNLNEVTIDQADARGTVSVSFGETVTLTPIITSSRGEEGMKNLTYSWVLDGEEISTEPKLEWKADHYTSGLDGNLTFTVTDTATDLEYVVIYTLEVIEKYDGDGIFILSKDRADNQVKLHMLKEQSEVVDNKNVFSYTFHPDIFSLENEGEALPNSTFKIHEHYAKQILSDDEEKIVNQLSFLSSNDLISADAGSLERTESTLASMFDGGSLPADLAAGVQDVYFGHYLDLVTDTKGHVYTRIKSSDEFFDVDKFLSEPLAYVNPQTNEKETLTGIKLLPLNVNTENCLLYDTDKNRLFVIWDCYFYDFGNESDNYVIGKVEQITSKIAPEWPDSIPNIETVLGGEYEILHFTPYHDSYNSTSIYNFMTLKHKETGIIYRYEFLLEKEYGNARLTLDSETYEEMQPDVASLLTNPNNVICTMRSMSISYFESSEKYTFIGVGTDLYVYIRNNPLGSQLRKVISFDSPIVALIDDDAASWPRRLGVIFQDGNAAVLSVEGAKHSTWDGLRWKSEDLDVGEPIDLFFEAGFGIDW